MRSKDVARLAGVSVRTLRHYHDLGLMPEPLCSANGYRDYAMSDVVRLLRIRRLSDLGFSLARVGEMLDGERMAASSAGELDALDAELACRIAELEEKRRVIAELRDERLDLDLSPTLARHIDALRRYGASDGVLALDKGILVLGGQEPCNDEETAVLDEFFRAFASSGLYEGYVACNEALLALPASASESERADLARRLFSVSVDIVSLIREKVPPPPLTASEKDVRADDAAAWDNVGFSPSSAVGRRSGAAAMLSQEEGPQGFGLLEMGRSRQTKIATEAFIDESLNDAQRDVNDRASEMVASYIRRLVDERDAVAARGSAEVRGAEAERVAAGGGGTAERSGVATRRGAAAAALDNAAEGVPAAQSDVAVGSRAAQDRWLDYFLEAVSFS